MKSGLKSKPTRALGDAFVSFTLAHLRAGESARIACVECERAERCERLIAYGLIEGQLITLVQRAPAFVIRVGQTELALDEEVARCVKVTRDASHAD